MEKPNLEEQLAKIDENLSDAVLDGNERMIRELQNQRMKIENVLLGTDSSIWKENPANDPIARKDGSRKLAA